MPGHCVLRRFHLHAFKLVVLFSTLACYSSLLGFIFWLHFVALLSTYKFSWGVPETHCHRATCGHLTSSPYPNFKLFTASYRVGDVFEYLLMFEMQGDSPH